MRRFYNVPCPCNRIEYEMVGQPTIPLSSLDAYEPQRTHVEMKVHWTRDFGKFLEELNQDGDYFIYTMLNGVYDGKTMVGFKYEFIPQSLKDQRGWGKVIRINEEKFNQEENE